MKPHKNDFPCQQLKILQWFSLIRSSGRKDMRIFTNTLPNHEGKGSEGGSNQVKTILGLAESPLNPAKTIRRDPTQVLGRKSNQRLEQEASSKPMPSSGILPQLTLVASSSPSYCAGLHAGRVFNVVSDLFHSIRCSIIHSFTIKV